MSPARISAWCCSHRARGTKSPWHLGTQAHLRWLHLWCFRVFFEKLSLTFVRKYGKSTENYFRKTFVLLVQMTGWLFLSLVLPRFTEEICDFKKDKTHKISGKYFSAWSSLGLTTWDSAQELTENWVCPLIRGLIQSLYFLVFLFFSVLSTVQLRL